MGFLVVCVRSLVGKLTVEDVWFLALRLGVLGQLGFRVQDQELLAPVSDCRALWKLRVVFKKLGGFQHMRRHVARQTHSSNVHSWRYVSAVGYRSISSKPELQTQG